MGVTDLWWITLGAGLLVALVVTALVAAIIAVAARIRRTAKEIWLAGLEIANNMATLDLLRRMNLVAADTLATAKRLSRRGPEGGEAGR